MNRFRIFACALSLASVAGFSIVGCGDAVNGPATGGVGDSGSGDSDARRSSDAERVETSGDVRVENGEGSAPDATEGDPDGGAGSDAPIGAGSDAPVGVNGLDAGASDATASDATSSDAPAPWDAPDSQTWDGESSNEGAAYVATDGGATDDGATDGGAMDARIFPSAGTTEAILSAQGADCFPCAERNGCLDPVLEGGTCESTPGVAPAACRAALGMSAPSEALVCIATLNEIFASGCASSRQETPCLCGATDPGTCLVGSESPTGPVLPLYTCDFDGTNARPASDFTNQAFGVGQANALVQCLAIFDCDCFP